LTPTTSTGSGSRRRPGRSSGEPDAVPAPRKATATRGPGTTPATRTPPVSESFPVEPGGPNVEPQTRPAFAHASEAEMARILDYYRIAWEYEPHTFPILWNLDGDVVESFSPDFWLPELDLYVELTTLRQKLVRKKNRKLRRVRELYPDLRIKLFYARDFRALMLKFGRYALFDELSGTSGHIGSMRGEVTEAETG
jgi:hypoxanthine phosphoribosyltransferase